MRRALFGALLPLVSVVSLGGCATHPPAPASAVSPLLATGAPEIQRAPLTESGQTVISLAAFRGRLVVVDFFAEFCQPCLRELPELAELQRSRPEVAVVAIAEDADPETSRRLVQRLELGFPAVYDRGHVLSGRYRVAALPATFVLDRSGVVRWVSQGACARAELEAVLDSLE